MVLVASNRRAWERKVYVSGVRVCVIGRGVVTLLLRSGGGGGRNSMRSPGGSGGVSSVELPLELLFRVDPSYMPSRRPRPRGTLYDHERPRRPDPLVGQPP